MAKDLFGRYVWIVDTLNRYGKLTRSELNKLWQRSSRGDGEEIPARTFFHYRRAIEENFNIEILCNAKGEYYINSDNSRQSKAYTNWILDQHAMSSTMRLSPDASARVDVEDVPSAREFFPIVYEAVSDKARIEFSYAGFNRARIERGIRFSPYMLKRYKQRWYMVGEKERGAGLRTYALDRVREMRLTSEHYDMPEGVEPEAIFANIIGVTSSKAPVKKVKIMVSPIQAKYFRALPLHSSQAEEMISDAYSIFTYELQLNYELVHELLSLGSNVKVLEPKELVTMVTTELHSTLYLYEHPEAIPAAGMAGRDIKKQRKEKI